MTAQMCLSLARTTDKHPKKLLVPFIKRKDHPRIKFQHTQGRANQICHDDPIYHFIIHIEFKL